MIIRYRLYFKDGARTAWTSNYEQVKKSFDFFFPLAEIETWIVEK